MRSRRMGLGGQAVDREDDAPASGLIVAPAIRPRAPRATITTSRRAARIELRPDAPLSLPEVTGKFQQKIGSSVIDEFVNAHRAADILRELVQNEFDGDGSEIGI